MIDAAVRSVGDYELGEVLGIGGMGVVYRATQRELGREVALKLVRGDCATPFTLEHFRREARMLGRLHHPGIAQVYDTGTAETADGGRAFISMELVDGVPITEFVRREELDVRGRLALFAKVCHAVHHAHECGVVHRDLKPGNVLVDTAGEPKVLDFGAAFAVDADALHGTLEASRDHFVGTLPYMSPEQLGGDRGDLDARSDVFALGILGYELLSGRLPYELGRRGIAEYVRALHLEEPRALGSLDIRFRGDLELIVSTAMARERERRYDSARALAEDVERYLLGERIAARPPSAVYQLGRFARRHKAIAGAVAATFLALVAGTVYAGGYAAEARHGADVARLEQRRADSLNEFILDFVDSWSDTRDLSNAHRAAVIERAAEALPEYFEGAVDSEIRARLLLGMAYFGHSLFAESEEQFSFAADLMAVHGSNRWHERTSLEIYRARCLLYIGEYEEALLRLESVEDTMRTRYRPMDWEYVSWRFARGACLARSGDVEAGLAIQRAAIEEYAMEEGRDPFLLTSLRGGYATTLEMLYRFDEQAAVYEEIARDMESVLGEHHSDVVDFRIQCGVALKNAGRDVEALARLGPAHEELLQVRGPEHPQVLTCANLLATTYMELGMHEEAVRTLRSALEGGERSRRVDPDVVVELRYHLGWAYVLHQRPDLARPHLVASIPDLDALLGPTSEAALGAREMLGHCLRLEGEPEGAVPLLAEVLEVYVEQRGPDDIETVRCASNLGRALFDLGRIEEAETFLRSSFDYCIENGPLGVDVAEIGVTLVDAYYELDRFDDAARIDRLLTEPGW